MIEMKQNKIKKKLLNFMRVCHLLTNSGMKIIKLLNLEFYGMKQIKFKKTKFLYLQ